MNGKGGAEAGRLPSGGFVIPKPSDSGMIVRLMPEYGERLYHIEE
jgi:hypothetical protein